MNFVYNCVFVPSYGTILGLTLGIFSCIITKTPQYYFYFCMNFL